MSWKCACKEENNPDESKICKNCGRTRPKYLGIKLDLSQTDKMTEEQKGVWYLMIAHDYLLESNKYLKEEQELRAGSELKLGVGEKVKDNCDKCLKLLEKAGQCSPNAQFEEDKGFIHSISSIKSNCYFNLGSLCFSKGNFEKAIENYQNSYDSDPNQVSIYNIAIATIDLPVEGGGIFGGKKKEAAMKAKREQQVELLKKTIRFAPFSEVGIKSGRMLMEKYAISEFDI